MTPIAPEYSQPDESPLNSQGVRVIPLTPVSHPLSQSTRLLPRYTKAYTYPADFQTRRVNDAGDISWYKNRVFISEVFRGEDIGLEKVEENFYRSTSATWKSENSMSTTYDFDQGFVLNCAIK